jgi:hypothetical protein
MIVTPQSVAFANWRILDVHAKRERLWVERIQQRRFESALGRRPPGKANPEKSEISSS